MSEIAPTDYERVKAALMKDDSTAGKLTLDCLRSLVGSDKECLMSDSIPKQICEDYFNHAQAGISAYKYEPGVKERLIQSIEKFWNKRFDMQKAENDLHSARAELSSTFYDIESALRWLAQDSPSDAKMVLESACKRLRPDIYG